MALKKIDITNIDRKEGFDTFEFLRNGGALDEQKVSAVIKVLVETVNEQTAIIEGLSNVLIKQNKKQIVKRMKGGEKLSSAK